MNPDNTASFWMVSKPKIILGAFSGNVLGGVNEIR